MQYPEAFNHLIECFKHLPGIGSKSAERLAYYILNMDDVYVKEFAGAVYGSQETRFNLSNT